jgi:hypothetical protein
LLAFAPASRLVSCRLLPFEAHPNCGASVAIVSDDCRSRLLVLEGPMSAFRAFDDKRIYRQFDRFADRERIGFVAGYTGIDETNSMFSTCSKNTYIIHRISDETFDLDILA